MYGRYTKDLGEFAKDEARKLKLLEKRRKLEDKQRNKVSNLVNCNGKVIKFVFNLKLFCFFFFIVFFIEKLILILKYENEWQIIFLR